MIGHVSIIERYSVNFLTSIYKIFILIIIKLEIIDKLSFCKIEKVEIFYSLFTAISDSQNFAKLYRKINLNLRIYIMICILVFYIVSFI